MSSIRIANGKIFKCCFYIFLFIFMFSQRCCNLHCFACNLRIWKAILQTALYTSFFYFQNYSSVFRDSLKSKGLFHVTATGTIMLHYLKGLLPPYVSALKGINFFFAACKKEKSAKIKEFTNTFTQLVKGSLITFIVIAKGYQIPLRANCMRNP